MNAYTTPPRRGTMARWRSCMVLRHAREIKLAKTSCGRIHQEWPLGTIMGAYTKCVGGVRGIFDSEDGSCNDSRREGSYNLWRSLQD